MFDVQEMIDNIKEHKHRKYSSLIIGFLDEYPVQIPDKEYMAGFKYIIGRNFALSAHYDSDMGFGGGLTLNY